MNDRNFQYDDDAQIRSDRAPQPDPYAPPPRHKERSGPVVRIVLIAAMLAAGVWAYTEYSQLPQEPLVAENQQQVAENEPFDPVNGYRVNPATDTPVPADEGATAPDATTPAPVEPAPTPPA